MQKSKNEMEKIGKQALNFFQDMAVKEGRGRFPGQTKFDQKVGGHNSLEELEEDLFGGPNYLLLLFKDLIVKMDQTGYQFLVLILILAPIKIKFRLIVTIPMLKLVGANLFGDEILNSPFQDGHYVYQVLPGSGSGSQSNAPTIFIADLENPSQINLVIQP